MKFWIFLSCLVLGAAAIPSYASAANPSQMLVIHDNQFEPRQLYVPADVKLKLVIRNLDGLPVEFESFDLSREIVVPGHGEVTFFVGPLLSGNYQFFNDFNHGMQGTIVAKPGANKGN